jgi:hypothetical protein
MPTSAYNKFNVVAQDILNGVHNFGSHTFKALLTNTAPVATNTVKANLTEITTGKRRAVWVHGNYKPVQLKAEYITRGKYVF